MCSVVWGEDQASIGDPNGMAVSWHRRLCISAVCAMTRQGRGEATEACARGFQGSMDSRIPGSRVQAVAHHEERVAVAEERHAHEPGVAHDRHRPLRPEPAMGRGVACVARG